MADNERNAPPVVFTRRNIADEVNRADPNRLSRPRVFYNFRRPRLGIDTFPGATYGWAKGLDLDE